MGNIRGGMNGFLGTIGQPTAQVIDGSLKFDAGSSQYLGRTPGSASNRRTWTWSAWVKRSVLGADKFIFSAGSDASNQHYLRFKSNNTLEATEKISDSTQSSLITNAVHRDTGWYHLVYVFDSTQSTSSDRVSLYVNGVKQTSLSTNTYPSLNHDTYINNNSAHYIGSSPLPSAYYDGGVSQVYLIDGQALGPEYFGFTDPLTNTWRPKKAKTDGPNVGTTWSSVSTISSGGAAGGKPLSNGFDGSISNAFEGDTSGATVTVPVSATIVKGGVKVYAAVTSGNPLVVLLKNGGTTVETINAGASGGQFYSSSTYSGPITSLVISRTGRAPEFNAIGINGIILKDDSTTNLAFGTNGFYLPMDNQDNFEKDKSGKGNDWTKNNFSGTSINPDVLKDSPSGAVFGGRAQTGITTTSSAPANYATYNAIDNHGNTLSNANLTITDTGDNWHSTFGSIPSSDGRHYFEVTPTTITTTCAIGVYVGNGRTDFNGNYPYDANTYMIHQNGNIYHAASTASYQSTYSANDTVGVAVDSKNRKVWISVNGTYVSGENPTTGVGGLQSVNGVGAMPDGEIYPVVTMRSAVANINFGQKPFKYAPPQGYLPLNSATARPNTVVPRPDQYVGVVTWSGDNVDGRKIDMGMAPDLIWVKTRNQTNWHWLTDTVRGAPNKLYANSTNAEDTTPIYGQADSFTYKGWIAGGGTDGSNPLSDSNQTGTNYVCWCWKAGGNKNTFNVDDVGYASAAAAGLDGGDLTVTGASVGTKQGFSIIKYTGSGNAGDSASHGLLEAPKFIITKNIDNGTYSWRVFTTVIDGSNDRLFLDGTNAKADQTDAPVPTSSVFYVGANLDHNKANDNIIAYLWHDVPGLQKFGIYTGNASSDGPFVETGMKPALVVFKKTSASGDAWLVYDATRDTHNPTAKRLFWNTTGAQVESNDYAIDIYSNGFKIRTLDGSWNASGATFIYMAWAEAPASNLFGGQSNAR